MKSLSEYREVLGDLREEFEEEVRRIDPATAVFLHIEQNPIGGYNGRVYSTMYLMWLNNRYYGRGE